MSRNDTRKYIHSISAFLSAWAILGSVAAAEPTADIPYAFRICATVPVPSERLACFDAAMSGVARRTTRSSALSAPIIDHNTTAGTRPAIPPAQSTMTAPARLPPPMAAKRGAVTTPVDHRPPRFLVEVSGGLSLASIDEAFTADILDATTNIRLNSIFGGRGGSIGASLLFPALLPWGLGLGIDYRFQRIDGDAVAELPDGIQILNDPIRADIDFAARSHALSIAVSANSGWNSRHQVHAALGIGANWNILDVTTRLSSPAIGEDAISRDRITDIAPSWHLSGGYRYLLSDQVHLSLSTRISGIPGDVYGADGRSALLVSVLAGGGLRF